MDRVTKWPLLAQTLGVATLGGPFAAPAAPPPNTPSTQELKQGQPLQHEIVVTASRPDAELATRVTLALEHDPYVFAEHLSVSATSEVVRVTGVVRDLDDLLAILRIARRAAGTRRVVNEIDFQPVDDDGN